jgi:DNA-binding NarL/FixJ family response regulator
LADAAERCSFNGVVRRGRGTDGWEPLSTREVELLTLVAAGMSNADIGRQLWVTEQTVKFHLSNIYKKLGVPSRTAAAMWFRDRELAPPKESRE